MKLLKLLLIGFTLFLSLVVTKSVVDSAESKVIYFKEATCLNCKELQDSGYFTLMENDGINVITYDIQDNTTTIPEYAYTNEDGETVDVLAIDVYAAFNDAYDRSDTSVPVIFAGGEYFEGVEEIQNAYDDGTLLTLSEEEFLDIDIVQGQAYLELTGFLGFLAVMGAGLLDGFNPCAIALLLLFVSLLGFSEDKRVLILVSVVYIFALFVSYFLIGTFFLNVLERFTAEISVVAKVINWFVAFLCLFLFLFNLYDYFQAKNEEYGNIKNQLPKWLKRYNKKIMKAFTNVINDKENKKGLIAILGITFLLGVTLSVTELVCTGQIYFGILYGIHTIESSYAYVLLLAYNLMFVLPLIVIAVISIKVKGVMTISNWIREHMSTIKLSNAILFFVIAAYFFYRIFV
jgi:cytochrome c biogenesis protein CcdA/glutaredoxin